jgi:nitric oxide reductase subunit B
MPNIGLKKFKNISDVLINQKLWFVQFFAISFMCLAGLYFLGDRTYSSAPPLPDYVDEAGQVVLSRAQIKQGQQLFHLRGLMNYGSFWGDGAERGPDFSAEALHVMVLALRRYYEQEYTHPLSDFDRDAIAARVKREIHLNRWDETLNIVRLNPAQVFAIKEITAYYQAMFRDPAHPGYFRAGYIRNKNDIADLSAFFYWGAWVAGTDRPGESHTYTHNWPYDPDAGNEPSAPTYFWSMVSIFVLFLGIGLVLYIYGQMKSTHYDPFYSHGERSLSTVDLENKIIRPTQRATYKFFMLSMVLFALQVLFGILAATDFVRPFGLYLGEIIPFNVARSYHTLFQIMWFFICWAGYTIFFLPALSRPPKGQIILINLMFWMCVCVGAGAMIGIYLGQTGRINDTLSYWFGSQGWEFMELGRAFQILLLIAFSLWIFIIYRGVKPYLTRQHVWSVPAWLLYGSAVMVLFLFFSLLVLPDSNFAVADFWRWMVVHMWVEVTFEVFTTVIVAFMMVQMGLITRVMAERVIFLAVMLFFATATLGVAHNFYWIAKPTSIIALGSVFSTLQVLPLLLLTLDAWRLHQEKQRASGLQGQGKQTRMMSEVWYFILAVNFWNVFGAGVFGSLINLPIVNYFEHATYLTGNHAHAAMFGVKGNIALAGMLFCCQHLVCETRWNAQLLRIIFWSLNIGVALMMFLDLFPVGVYQLITVLEEGFWKARSPEVVSGEIFRNLTIFRSVGGTLFVVGGVVPLVWFIFSRKRSIQ